MLLLTDSAERIAELTDEEIEAIVESADYTDETLKQDIITALKERRDYIKETILQKEKSKPSFEELVGKLSDETLSDKEKYEAAGDILDNYPGSFVEQEALRIEREWQEKATENLVRGFETDSEATQISPSQREELQKLFP